ncbi:bile acid:sodium symporter family protein [Leekyejoonella antrihumi]|uniref:bile acid:sodium symporter family protein n=1 Tax=Leekyejoonella antrihumi TaxID=1660198 RepID=UPI001FE9C1F7|nr:bile acid:sodium symporter family protein [Leekyejoonella antrihumi]
MPNKLRIDGFIIAILATVACATVLPASAGFAPTLEWIVHLAIGLLFFLYGARMHPREALDGLKHWRLHVTILSFTFVIFPVVGIALRVLEPHLLTPTLYTGVLYLTLVPSTVQSSIAFTSIARGNVAGSIVSASASNLLGVVLTPGLVLLMASAGLMGSSGSIQISTSQIGDIFVQLLLPFILGQLARPLVGRFVTEHAKRLKIVDRGSILLVVYSAFSTGMRQGIWHSVTAWQILLLIGLAIAIVAFMLWLTSWVSHRFSFDRGDLIAVQFCGTKKSLASGLPMAAVLFAGQPVGLIVLPLMIFHQVQLMMCSWLAARYSRESLREPPTSRVQELDHG